MTEELAEKFRQQTKSALNDGKLSQDSYEQLQAIPLDSLEWLERAYTQYMDMLSRPNYYKLLERLVRGAEYIERFDITEAQRAKGLQLYNKLVAELEGLHE